jgi:alpha-D-glucose phosphate-specific phosphoglucomutase
MVEIKFGTDGWRSIIAEDFTFQNVRALAQAIANHINTKYGQGEGIVVGYDNRFLSEGFAQAVAEVLAGSSIPVFMSPGAMPTPVVAFAIKKFKARGGVMITASHNPPQYNGIKFIPEYAGPALPEETEKIEENLNIILETKNIKKITKETAVKKGLWKEINPAPDYGEHIKSLVNNSVIREAGLQVVVDPLFGAGIGYLEEILGDLGCSLETIHGYRDPLFGGSMPDPGEKNLALLKERVLNTGAHLGLALDGDADRFGVIDSGGEFLTPNEILFLILVHLVRTKKIKGSVARTVATTHMLDKVAFQYDMKVLETPVGFKYIGQCLLHNGSILGGEESGGMSIKGHVPEKDGILGSMLVAEIIAAAGKPLIELQAEYFKEFGTLVSRRMDLPVASEKKNQILENLKDYRPTFLAGEKVVEKNSIDGLKLICGDGSWVLVRPSGTEPLFRVYTEADNESHLHEIQSQVRADLGI